MTLFLSLLKGDYDKALSTHLNCREQRENLLEEDPIQVIEILFSILI